MNTDAYDHLGIGYNFYSALSSFAPTRRDLWLIFIILRQAYG